MKRVEDDVLLAFKRKASRRAATEEDLIAARDKELKAKVTELEETKSKYKTEIEERKKLQLQVEELTSDQTESAQRLKHFVETNDRLRVEVRQKTVSLEKLEKNVAYMEDRIRNLEIKGSEVEKAELTLESTKKVLENSQEECRRKDSELRRMTVKMNETERERNFSTKKNLELEEKIVDLKQQVRQELMTNESMERGLESLPKMKTRIEEDKQHIEELEKELADTQALLTASKQAVRDYKDKIRIANDRVTETEELKDDLTLAQHEIDTLKNLMKGKDKMIIQKVQALEQAKSVLNSPKHGDKSEDVNNLRSSIDKLSKLIRSDHSLDTNKRGSSAYTSTRAKSASFRSKFMTNGQVSSSSINDVSISRRFDNKNTDNRKPATAIVYPSVRPNTVAGSYSRHKKYITTEFDIFSDNLGNSYSKTSRNRLDSERTDSGRTDSQTSECDSPYMLDTINSLSTRKKYEILGNIISVGDRIKVNVPQKPPRYGRKKSNPIIYTGIVKYKGYLDKTSHDACLMVGIKLDEPYGDNEGMINGKSFMFVPTNHGKFFKITQVTSVFDPNTGCYISTEILIVQYANQHNIVSDDDNEVYSDSDSSS